MPDTTPPTPQGVEAPPPTAPAPEPGFFAPEHSPILRDLYMTERALVADCLYAFRSDGFNWQDGYFTLSRTHRVNAPGLATTLRMGHVWQVRVTAAKRERWIRMGLVEKIPRGLGSHFHYRLALVVLAGVNLPRVCDSKSTFQARRAELVELNKVLAKTPRGAP